MTSSGITRKDFTTYAPAGSEEVWAQLDIASPTEDGQIQNKADGVLDRTDIHKHLLGSVSSSKTAAAAGMAAISAPETADQIQARTALSEKQTEVLFRSGANAYAKMQDTSLPIDVRRRHLASALRFFQTAGENGSGTSKYMALNAAATMLMEPREHAPDYALARTYLEALIPAMPAEAGAAKKMAEANLKICNAMVLGEELQGLLRDGQLEWRRGLKWGFEADGNVFVDSEALRFFREFSTATQTAVLAYREATGDALAIPEFLAYIPGIKKFLDRAVDQTVEAVKASVTERALNDPLPKPLSEVRDDIDRWGLREKQAYKEIPVELQGGSTLEPYRSRLEPRAKYRVEIPEATVDAAEPSFFDKFWDVVKEIFTLSIADTRTFNGSLTASEKQDAMARAKALLDVPGIREAYVTEDGTFDWRALREDIKKALLKANVWMIEQERDLRADLMTGEMRRLLDTRYGQAEKSQ